MTPTPALQAIGLHKSYGRTTALKGVDITLMPGQFHVLLGPNGAGKSTLLHLLGVDHLRLTYKFQGRHYRLTDVHGNVVRGLLV